MTAPPPIPAFVSCVLTVPAPDGAAVQRVRAWDREMASAFTTHELVVVLLSETSNATLEDLASQLTGTHGTTTLLRLARNQDTEVAMMAGLERSTGDFVIEADPPGAPVPAAVLVDLHDRCSRGIDILAVRPRQTPRNRNLFYGVLNRYSELEIELHSERLRIVSRRAVNAVLAMPEKIRYRKALYALTGYGYDVVAHDDLSWGHDRDGVSPERPSVWIAVELLLSYSHVGLRVVHLLTGLFGLFSLGALGYMVVVSLLLDSVVEGWTTVMAVLTVGLTGIFLTLGVVGEYLARILMEVRDRPLYRVREMVTIARETDEVPDSAAE